MTVGKSSRMSLSVIRHRARFKYSWSNHSWNINLYREHNTSENKAFPGTSPVYFSRSAILESYLRILKSYYKTPRICCKGVIWKYILNMCVCVCVLQVLYIDGASLDADPLALSLPDCGNPCYFDTFLNSTKRYYTDVNYDQECLENFPTSL